MPPLDRNGGIVMTLKVTWKMFINTPSPPPMNRNEGNTPVLEPERKLYMYQNMYHHLTELDKTPWPVEHSISWDLYSNYS